MLEEITDDFWLVEGDPVNFYGFPYPTRSVVVRLTDGGLWIWSPIRLSDDLRRAVDRLGTPRHLVSPNKIHHLFLVDWHSVYPEALLWGPRSTIKKRSDLQFQEELSDKPPVVWRDVIDQVWFHGSPFMDEIVFFHRPSGTAILADLSENFSQEFMRQNWRPWQRWIANVWGIVEGRGYPPLEWRISFFDRTSTRAAREKVLAWNAERVIMAHGEWQRTDGRNFLEKSFAWVR